MKVYYVSPIDDAIEGARYFTNKTDAFKAAREIAAGGTEATVDADTIRPGRGRDLLVALLNRSGFSLATEVVKVFPAKEVVIE